MIISINTARHLVDSTIKLYWFFSGQNHPETTVGLSYFEFLADKIIPKYKKVILNFRWTEPSQNTSKLFWIFWRKNHPETPASYFDFLADRTIPKHQIFWLFCQTEPSGNTSKLFWIFKTVPKRRKLFWIFADRTIQNTRKMFFNDFWQKEPSKTPEKCM